MATQKTLNKNFVIENNQVKITETTEKNLTREDLVMERMSYLQQQQQILNQIQQFKDRYTALDSAIIEIDEMIAAIGVDEIEQ